MTAPKKPSENHLPGVGKKLVLVVIDALKPSMLDRAIANGRAPAPGDQQPQESGKGDRPHGRRDDRKHRKQRRAALGVDGNGCGRCPVQPSADAGQ